MKIKIICVLMIAILFLPVLTAQKTYKLPYENDIEKNQDDVEPRPHFGLSFVYYFGEGLVYDYYVKDDYQFITVRPMSKDIKWFCIGRPFGRDSASATFVVGIDYFKGFIGPKPIEKDVYINFMFGLAKDIVVMIA